MTACSQRNHGEKPVPLTTPVGPYLPARCPCRHSTAEADGCVRFCTKRAHCTPRASLPGQIPPCLRVATKIARALPLQQGPCGSQSRRSRLWQPQPERTRSASRPPVPVRSVPVCPHKARRRPCNDEKHDVWSRARALPLPEPGSAARPFCPGGKMDVTLCECVVPGAMQMRCDALGFC